MERPRPGRAVVLTAVLLVLLRGALELLPENHSLASDSVRVRDFWRVESDVREELVRPPRVILSGSSRVLWMKSKQHARALGLPPSAVVHASKLGNGWWDTLTLLRRNPELLENLELLVMDVYPAQERISERFTEDDRFFLRHARLSERWRVRDAGSRLKALVDPVLPIWTERLRVTEWLQALRALVTGEALGVPESAQMLEIRDVFGQVTPQERLEMQAEYLFPDAPRSRVELGALRDLADLMPEGSRLLLVWLPFRDDFREVVARDEDMRRVGKSFRSMLAGFEHPRVETVWFDDQDELGLEDGDYTIDGAHLNPVGNAKLLRALVEVERQLLRNP